MSKLFKNQSKSVNIEGFATLLRNLPFSELLSGGGEAGGKLEAVALKPCGAPSRVLIMTSSMIDRRHKSLNLADTYVLPHLWLVIEDERDGVFVGIHGIGSGEHAIEECLADAFVGMLLVDLFESCS